MRPNSVCCALLNQAGNRSVDLAGVRGVRHAANRIQQFVQFVRLDRFREVSIHSSLDAALAVTLHCVRGESVDRDMGTGPFLLFPNDSGRLETAELAHLKVHEDDIKYALSE